MHLKVIEMVGFKSFANKTRIELDKGFTAIVGPNGSGKSNITEAIKWVLGEQSAKSLRGHKMNDVIFAGAQDKNRSQYAEVTLTFENTDRVLDIDMDEVSVTRRYTRAGESTYLINRQPCRLRDIVEMMMDTGVGRESFSIISQGKVESIFLQKAEDRRGIFEEAAGVMKYKNRKKTAERKLERAEDNLQRIYDILGEVEGRLAPLEKQRQAAVKYQSKKAELSDIEIALTTVQIETISEQWGIAKKDLVRYNEDIVHKKTALHQASLAAASYRNEEVNIEDTLNKLQEDYVDVVQRAEKVQTKIQVHQQQAAFNQRDRDSQERSLAELLETIKEAKDNLTYATREVTKLNQDYEKQATNLKIVKKELESLESDSQELLEAARDQYISSLQQQTNLRNQISQSEKELEMGEQRAARYDRQLSENQERLVEIKKSKHEIEEDLSVKAVEIKSLLDDYQSKAKAVSQLSSEGRNKQEKLNQLSQTSMRLEARKNSLEDLERENAGFYQGVKAALNMQDDIKGIHGAIAQLMTVSAEYTTAVEIALAGGMQNIVTDNSQVASQVITALKKQKAGRATFLPLDVIKGRKVSDHIMDTAHRIPGFIGVLVDLVEFNPKYQAIMANSMGSILVVDSLDNGQKLAQAIQYKQRIVSLEGDIINAGGSMTGGANKHQNSGLLSRKVDIDRLEQKITTAQAEQEELASQLSRMTGQLELLQVELADLKAAGDEARFEERSIKQDLESIDKQIVDLVADIDLQTYENNLQLANRKALSESLASNQEKYQAVSEIVTTLKQKIDNMSLSASEKESRRSDIQAKYQTIATDFAVLKERKRQAQAEFKAQEKALKAYEDNYLHMTEQLNQSKQHISSQTDSSADLEKTYADLVNKQESLNQEIKNLREARQSIHNKRELSDQEINDLNEQLQNLMQKQAKLEATVARYGSQIDSHLEQLSEEYGLTYERARAESELTMSIETASSRVRQLKKEIEHIGPVNLNAIAEYEEINERYVFMTKQRDDVLASKEMLYHTITEMDDEVIERFRQTFNLIRDQFEMIFPKLFGGGKASLELTDPTDLLTTGVEISAQPPGKRLQHLSLLSGGEKALTAIALLFAILQVKVVPFSILDEVEAALDEANVSRFGKFLREFMTKTQFIVITHRKGTMEEAHLLYGVTMQDSGVSKLASVRLEDYELVDSK